METETTNIYIKNEKDFLSNYIPWKKFESRQIKKKNFLCLHNLMGSTAKYFLGSCSGYGWVID
jgi:hypothetical protein